MSNHLDQLNEQQRVAASALLGPVRVLAGAGTGKTRTITHRIAHGIATDVYQPQWVMALTFTSKAAAEMRLRLRQLGVPPVAARTFHAAALAQLRFFWPGVVGGRPPHILDSKIRVIREAAEAVHVNAGTELLRQLAAEIEWRKVRNLTIEQYREQGRLLPIEPDAVSRLMLTYERLKDDQRAMDFEDVLLATVGMLRNEPGIAQQVHDQYRVFVVDEYQDVSPVQQELLELWLGRRRDLCVVGDVSQTIYSFAGADSSFLLNFDRKFPGATSIELTQNYRSTKQIVASANRLMMGSAGAIRLEAEVDGLAPTVTEYATDDGEAKGVAERISTLLRQGVHPSEIAVLVRINAQSALFESTFAAAGVPYRLRDGKPFFARPEILRAIMLLSAERAQTPQRPLFQVVSDVIRFLGWTSQPPTEPGPLREVWDTLNTLLQLADGMPTGAGVTEFVAELEQRKAHQHEPSPVAVTISTVHAAKGLEWQHVFVCGLAEGQFPLSYAQLSPETVDEERRLLYVAVTRARKTLALSWARAANLNAQVRSGSRFLGMLGIPSKRVKRPGG